MEEILNLINESKNPDKAMEMAIDLLKAFLKEP
jgi:hypothetical protein